MAHGTIIQFFLHERLIEELAVPDDWSEDDLDRYTNTGFGRNGYNWDQVKVLQGETSDLTIAAL